VPTIQILNRLIYKHQHLKYLSQQLHAT